MPTGPLNRVSDNSLAARLLKWRPEVAFADGLKRTIDWYFSTKSPAQAAEALALSYKEAAQWTSSHR
jgi:dTDP-D-glucose 4,6-dehydratase